MKANFTFLRSFFALLLFMPLALSAQIYVDTDAAGNNNGTSWADAYNDLQDALEDTASDTVWIADGTYYPGRGSADTLSAFTVTREMALYGGFAGGESSLGDRDVANNRTIFDADINGDDIQDNFDSLKMDNVFNVFRVDSLAGEVTFDGLTISGGRTSDDGDGPDENWQGGGIYSKSTLMVHNCTFTDNYGRTGGSISIVGPNTAGSRFMNNKFSNNGSTGSSAGIFMEESDGNVVDNCEFSDNSTTRGAFYSLFCDGTTVTNSTFSGNVGSITGGAMWVWENVNLELHNNTFQNNSSTGNGGAIFINGSLDSKITDNDFDGNTADGFGAGLYLLGSIDSRIMNNTFTGNSAPTGRGGGLYLREGVNELVKNCTFSGNTADNAGGIYLVGIDGDRQNTATIDSCTLSGNSTTGYGGGGFMAFAANIEITNTTISRNTTGSAGAFYAGDGTNINFTNCIITSNTSTWSGGGSTFGGITNFTDCEITSNGAENGGGGGLCGFQGVATFTNCLFKDNTAGFGAGFGMQNDSSTTNLINCSFENNTANGEGAVGGGYAAYFGGGFSTIMDCNFESNGAEGFGGAVHFTEDSLNIASAMIMNTTFTLNSAGEQGGAVNVSNGNAMIINCLFNSNGASGTAPAGRGGAISNNASLGGESDSSIVMVINSTFVNNLGDFASTLVQWEEADNADFPDSTGAAVTMLQNNIFYDGGTAYAIEAGSPDVVSMGGNLTFNSDAFNTYLDQPSDILNMDPMFVNDGSDINNPEDYHVMAGSPAIDAGVAEGAPDEDLDGVPRDDMPDIGSYEFVLVNTQEIVDNSALELTPNPTPGELKITLVNEWSGDIELAIVNNIGQVVRKEFLNKAGEEFNHRINVGQLQAGMYQLILYTQDQAVVRPFVKQ